jgi:hypothetical protein
MLSMTASSVSPSASRFYQRWLAAAADRAAKVDNLAQLSLAQLDLADYLTKESQAVPEGAPPLPLVRAMRRLRNLLVCGLIQRDLEGKADLAEVVETMTRFADFAIQRHLAELHAEMVTAHGTPIGRDSGQPQEMMVLAMGKQGGGELNVSSDIDLIFVYPEDGDTTAGPGQRSLSNHEFFIRLGKKLIAALAEITEDGYTFRVDMALRPNGGSGPLAASLSMVEELPDRSGPRVGTLRLGQGARRHRRAEDIAALDAIVRPFVLPPLPGLRRDRRDPQHARADPRRGQPPGAAAPGPQQQRQAGARRDPRDRIPGAGVPADPRRPRRRPARPFDPHHLRMLAERPAKPRSSINCWLPTLSCATWNTACNTWTTPRPTPCRPMTPTA